MKRVLMLPGDAPSKRPRTGEVPPPWIQESHDQAAQATMDTREESWTVVGWHWRSTTGTQWELWHHSAGSLAEVHVGLAHSDTLRASVRVPNIARHAL